MVQVPSKYMKIDQSMVHPPSKYTTTGQSKLRPAVKRMKFDKPIKNKILLTKPIGFQLHRQAYPLRIPHATERCIKELHGQMFPQ